MVSTRIFRPSNNWSDRKSIDQQSFAAAGTPRCSRRFAEIVRFGVFRRNCRPSSRYRRRVRLWLMVHPSRRSRKWMGR